jgi:hypothetical protein
MLGKRNHRWFLNFGMAVAGALFAFTSPAHAIVGTNLVREYDPSTCRVLFFDSADTLLDFCSATLVSPKELLLAAHCFDAFANVDFKMQIKCDSKGEGLVPKLYRTKDPKIPVQDWAEFATPALTPLGYETVGNYVPATHTTSAKNDQARIVLTNETTVSPMPLATAEEVKHLLVPVGNHSHLNPNAECRIAGYGMCKYSHVAVLNAGVLDPNANYDFAADGELLSSVQRKITPQQLSKLRPFAEAMKTDPNQANLLDYLDQFSKIAQLSAIGAKGDSGGPLYCRINQGPWKLYGIGSGVRDAVQGTATDPVLSFDMVWASLSGMKEFLKL